MLGTEYLMRPSDDLDPDLTKMVERFATRAGRYEHLDSLWKDDIEVYTFAEWSALATRASLPKEVHNQIHLKPAMDYAIRSELSDDGLESTAQMVMEDVEIPMYEPSVAVVLSLFRKARWVSSILNLAMYYYKGRPIWERS